MARKRLKKRTFSEFMSWLEGVEAMQGSDWAPDSNQWKAIREMLNNVIPDEYEVQVQAPQPIAAPVAQWVQPPQGYQPVDNSNGQQPLPPQAPNESALEPPPRRQVPSGFKQPPKVRTTKKDEMIDTSDGGYESEYL